MDWQMRLITLYISICKAYEEKLCISVWRSTNGGYKRFSDAEVMTLYIWGTLMGLRTIKSIHRYAAQHLKSWFPQMPKYSGFEHRLNQLAPAFEGLVDLFCQSLLTDYEDSVYLIDSFPIGLAHGNHAYTARVAQEIASKSYNSTKKMYYHGLKAHIVARKREQSLPEIQFILIDAAGRQDGPIFDKIRPMLHSNLVFGDQAYKRPDADKIETIQDLKVFTPITKPRRQAQLDPQQRVFSNAVSRMRQPIESLFAWINKTTGIQNASNVRSAAGLLTHVFGKLAAALFLKICPVLA